MLLVVPTRHLPTQEVIEIKKDVRQIQVQLQATLSEAASGESQLQQSRQELKTEQERLAKLRNKVTMYVRRRQRVATTPRETGQW